MKGLNKLHGFQRSRHGLAWDIYKCLPAIGCGIVLLMKGPAYVADPYPPPRARPAGLRDGAR